MHVDSLILVSGALNRVLKDVCIEWVCRCIPDRLGQVAQG